MDWQGMERTLVVITALIAGIALGLWWLLILSGWLLLRCLLGLIVPDDEPDWTAEAQQGLTDSDEEETK